MALRQQNEELAARAAEATQRLEEKEAELTALEGLQISNIEAHKSAQSSPTTSPVAHRRQSSPAIARRSPSVVGEAEA